MNITRYNMTKREEALVEAALIFFAAHFDGPPKKAIYPMETTETTLLARNEDDVVATREEIADLSQRFAVEPMKPFVTKRIAAGYMIQCGKNGNARWLTPEGTWDRSIFEGAAFPKREQAEKVLESIECYEND